MLQVSIISGQCQSQLSIRQCQFQFSFFVLVYRFIDFRYDYDNDRFQVSSYRYVSLSASEVPSSLKRGGVSELSQAQVDR
jgi:hypothetical protein